MRLPCGRQHQRNNEAITKSLKPIAGRWPAPASLFVRYFYFHKHNLCGTRPPTNGASPPGSPARSRGLTPEQDFTTVRFGLSPFFSKTFFQPVFLEMTNGPFPDRQGNRGLFCRNLRLFFRQTADTDPGPGFPA